MDTLQLHIKQSNAQFYVATLALGLLIAMKSEKISLETGIWSLGRPEFLNKTLPFCSPNLQNILQSFDELDALSELSSKQQVMQQIDDWIEYLQNLLADEVKKIDLLIQVEKSV